VGIGLISVTVTWSITGDGDLHVETPGNAHIYWNQPTDATGGQLDVQSTVKGPENIYWPIGSSPSAGTYNICFDNYSGIATSSYVITIKVTGHADVVVPGNFPIHALNPNLACNNGNSIYITSFTYP